MYFKLIIILFLIILILLINRENFQMMFSPDSTNNNHSILEDITLTADLPASLSKYQTENRCLKFEANASCTDTRKDPFKNKKCDELVGGGQSSGICRCENEDVEVKCSDELTFCSEKCRLLNKTKSIFFDGKTSRVTLAHTVDLQKGFEVHFFAKMVNIKRFPIREQVLLSIADTNENTIFSIHINTDNQLVFLDHKNNQRFTHKTKLSNEFHKIIYGSKLSDHYIQVDNEKKEFANQNLTQTELVLIFGNIPKKASPSRLYNNFHGIIGGIEIKNKYQPNATDNDSDSLLNSRMLNKCAYAPEGNTLGQCIRKCKNERGTNNCSMDECIYRCEKCSDKRKCKFIKPEKKCSVLEPDQVESEESATRCTFQPWGSSEAHCISQCNTGANRHIYGGENCTRESCAQICKTCDNTRYCPWLTGGGSGSESASVPDPPSNLIGIPANNMALIMFSQPNNNNSPITAYKVLYYKTLNPDEGIFMYHITGNQIRSPLRYNLRGLINGVDYTIGVVAINSIGSSKLSSVINVKPNQVGNFEGFQNPPTQETNTGRNDENESEESCNLFNSLRGSTIEIHL